MWLLVGAKTQLRPECPDGCETPFCGANVYGLDSCHVFYIKESNVLQEASACFETAPAPHNFEFCGKDITLSIAILTPFHEKLPKMKLTKYTTLWIIEVFLTLHGILSPE